MNTATRATLAIVGIAVLIGAFIVFGGGGDDDRGGIGSTGETATGSPSPTPTGRATDPDDGDDHETSGANDSGEAETGGTRPADHESESHDVPVLRSGKVTEFTVKSGETVHFRVKSQTADEIHVHGYDVEKEVPAGETVDVEFKGDIEGSFEIEFHESGEQIGELKVEP